MNGGGKQQTTQTTNSAPWTGAQPALGQALGGAQDLVNRGIGGQVYTGSTYAPASKGSIMAAEASGNLGTSNSGGNGLSGQLQGIINSGGYNSAQNDALKNTRDIANGSFNINEDPGFQQVVDQATTAVNGNASAAGRYGSGTNQQLLGNTIGDLGARQYQAWQSRKDAANSNLFNMGQTAQGNLSSAYAGQQAPIQNLAQWGAFVDDYNNKEINDRLRVFNESQSKPWEQISRLNGIASGAGQLGGTSTQSQPGSNPFLTALGYGATGAGLLGSFF